MTEVCSIKFKSRGKVYFFDPSGIEIHPGDHVIVETSNGLELGECAKGNHEVSDESIVAPLRPVLRKADEADLRAAERNKSRESEAFSICQKKIEDHGLDMKLVDVEYNFEGNKILFFFTSDGRVDFRDLVKDLASVFRTRIELRQIGVRDEAKMIGGIGICGRSFCCRQFLDDFRPVSTKMAKTQSMSLNQSKISGSCGRLMCCLRYEQDAYEDLIKTSPKNGAFVETPSGYGNISQINLLRQKVKVTIDGGGEPVHKTYNMDEIAVIPGGRPAPGEPLPALLEPAVRLAVLKREEEAQQAARSSLWEQDRLRGSVPDVPEASAKPEQKNSFKKKSEKRQPRRGDKAAPESGQRTAALQQRETPEKTPARRESPKKLPPQAVRPDSAPARQAKQHQPQGEGKTEKRRGFRPRRRGNKSPGAEKSQ